MQLMPATAPRVAQLIRLAFSPHKLDDPDLQRPPRRAYLDGLLGDFEGSYILALAAYNAGPAGPGAGSRSSATPATPRSTWSTGSRPFPSPRPVTMCSG